MRLIKWTSLIAAIVLVIACFMDWIIVESRGIVISGVDAGGTAVGKPGYMHLVLTAFLHYEDDIEAYGREVLPLVRKLEAEGRGKDAEDEIRRTGDIYRK